MPAGDPREAAPRGRVIATDVRGDYLAVLSRRAAGAGRRNIVTRRVSRDDPGLAPRSVDLVVLCQVDHLLDDRARYLAALERALRPNGRIVLINLITGGIVFFSLSTLQTREQTARIQRESILFAQFSTAQVVSDFSNSPSLVYVNPSCWYTAKFPLSGMSCGATPWLSLNSRQFSLFIRSIVWAFSRASSDL